MKFIKHFLSDVKNSFYNPAFYSELKNRTLGNGVKNILFLNFILGAVFAIGIVAFAVPAYKDFQEKKYVETYYPQELTVYIKDGQASTTVSEPYFIKASAYHKTNNPQIQNYLVINTQKDVSLDTIASYQSYVVLTKDAVIVQESQTESSTYSLNSVKDLVISKAQVTMWENEIISRLKKFAVPIALLFLGMFTLTATAYWLFIMLLWAWVPLLVARLQKKKLTYKESYKTGLYAVVPVILLSVVFMVFGISIGGITSLLLYSLILVLNIEKEATEVSDPTDPN